MSRPIVLVVEDVDVFRLVEEGALQGAGYATRWTDATNTAAKFIAQGESNAAERIALVILDFQDVREEEYGPVLQRQGENLLRRLRVDLQFSKERLPVIATTAWLPADRSSFEKQAMEAGANAFFEQPVDLQELVAAVRKLVPLER